MQKFVDRIYDYFFKKDSKGQEWNYEDELIKTKIFHTKKTGIPPDLVDPIETRYYDKLLEQVKVLVGTPSFSGMRIAEFGSGTGLLSIQMAKEGATADLFDILPSCLQYAKMVVNYQKKEDEFLGKVNFVNEDFLNLRKGRELYDLVHNVGVIEHFNSKVALKMVRKMVDSTKKGGHVVVGVPNYFSPDLINTWRVYGKSNERFMRKKELRKLLIKAGLVRVEIETSIFFYPSFVPQPIVHRSQFLEDFLGRRCGLGFLIIGAGFKA